MVYDALVHLGPIQLFQVFGVAEGFANNKGIALSTPLPELLHNWAICVALFQLNQASAKLTHIRLYASNTLCRRVDCAHLEKQAA